MSVIHVECPSCDSEVGAIARGRDSEWPNPVSAFLRCNQCGSQMRFEHSEDVSEPQPVMFLALPDEDEPSGEQRFPPGEYRWKLVGRDSAFHH